jgi:hypothetical protein
VSIKDFPEFTYSRDIHYVYDSVLLGKFTMAEKGALDYVRVMLFVGPVNAITSVKKYKVIVYRDSDEQVFFDESNLIDLTGLQGAYSPNFLGHVTFDLNKKMLYPNDSIYCFIQGNLETSNAQTALIYDYPIPNYSITNSVFLRNPFKTQFFLRQEV